MMQYPYLSTPLSRTTRTSGQAGFTLIELLIALALTLVIVVAVQRYVAGVTSDQDHLSNQQDQTTQTFIVLNNIQRDVARAGYTPVATQLDMPSVVPIEIKPCGINECQGDELIIRYWQYDTGSIYDCVGHKVKKQNHWALVENTYQVRTSGELSCGGSGGDGEYTYALLDNVYSHAWSLSKDTSAPQLLHLCLTTTLGRNEQVTGTHQPKDCVTGTNLDAKNYRTTEVDLLVRPTQTTALDFANQGAVK